MSTVRFANICDVPGCGNRSEEYSSFPSCRDCQDDICPEHQVEGSLDEETGIAQCIECASLALKAKFRFVHIHACRPGAGDWFTLQRGDFLPLRWNQVKEHRAELKSLITKEKMKMGQIGDAYSEWKDWGLLPEWAKPLLEQEPIA